MRAAIGLWVTAAVLVLAAVLWAPVAEPRLVRLPTDFDTTIVATGTFEVHAAPGTLAPLPEPVSQPITVTIDFKAIGTSGDDVVVSFDQIQAVGDPSGPTQDVTFQSQLVLDRRSTMNLDDPQAWAFDPSNRVDRSGSYSATFGFDFDPAGSYPFWDDTIAASYALTAVDDATTEIEGLSATIIAGGVENHPASPVWIARLAPLQLPATLDGAQWSTVGFDIGAGSGPVGADYVVSLSTRIAVDDVTGATAALEEERVTLSVRPSTGGTPAEPKVVFTSTLTESQQSIETDTAEIRDNLGMIRLAETWIPLGLAVLGLLFGLGGTARALVVRRRTA